MDILTNLQEYGVIGAAFTIVLIILKYNGKQGWKESLGLSDREKFFSSFFANTNNYNDNAIYFFVFGIY